MKNKLIREKYTALSNLSGRVLPSKTAVHKVATLLAVKFERAYQATELSRKQVIAEHPLPDLWDKESLPHSVAEARQAAMDELMEQSTPVPKVSDKLRLTFDDLPKVLKRDGGEGNAEGVAGLIVMLGSLYVKGADETALNEATEGEEPDELPEPDAPDPFALAEGATAE